MPSVAGVGPSLLFPLVNNPEGDDGDSAYDFTGKENKNFDISEIPGREPAGAGVRCTRPESQCQAWFLLLLPLVNNPEGGSSDSVYDFTKENKFDSNATKSS